MVSGPSVIVRVLGDLTGLGKSFDQTSTQGASAASKMHGAFSGVLDQLNASGVLGPFGSALATADGAIQSITGHAKEIGPVMMGVGGAVAGLGLALQAAGSKDQAAHQQLQASVAATGHSYDQYSEKVEAAIKHQETFGHTADETQNALSALTQATNDPKKALDLLNTATDLAAAKHESLTEAAGQLGKAYNGNGRILKEFGLSVGTAGSATKVLETATKSHTEAVNKAATATHALSELQAIDATKKTLTTAETLKLKDAQDKVNAANLTVLGTAAQMKKAQDDQKNGTDANTKALDELGKKLSGQASAAADTFSGKLDAMKAKIEDQVATLGQKYGPALTAAGAAATGLGAMVEIAGAAVAFFKDQQIIATVSTYAMGAAMAVLDAVMDANPIMLVILAIAGLIAIIAVVITALGGWGAVMNDTKRIALDVFNGIVGAAQSAFNWIASNWPLLLAILTGPFGLAVLAIKNNWGTLVTFFQGVPADIEGIAGRMWAPISGAFRGELNDIIDLWNSLKFTLPSVNVGPVHLGGETIGVPQVPHLAQGGLITADGLIYAHAGEAITPAPEAGRRAPAVHVEHLTLASPLDVDAFMRRAAWVARTAVL
jgi:hypothetical protein